MDDYFIINNLPKWSKDLILQRLNIINCQDLTSENIHFLTNSKKEYLNKIIFNLKNNIPISKILGIKYFYDGVFVNHNVLDPRYDSEIIVDILRYINNCIPIQNNNKYKIIELGGGSGCLSVTALQIIENSIITIIEKNPRSVITLKRNIKKNNLINRATVFTGSWWEPIKKLPDNQFNLLIFNPPYLSLQDICEKNNVYETYNDPLMALYGGIDGLQDYKRVIPYIKKYINDYVIMEICTNKVDAIINLLSYYKLKNIKIFNDLQQKPRMILIKI